MNTVPGIAVMVTRNVSDGFLSQCEISARFNICDDSLNFVVDLVDGDVVGLLVGGIF